MVEKEVQKAVSEETGELRVKLSRLRKLSIGLFSMAVIASVVSGFLIQRTRTAQAKTHQQFEALFERQQQLEQMIQNFSVAYEQQQIKFHEVDSLTQTNANAIISLQQWFERYVRQHP